MFGHERQRHCPPDGELRALVDGGFEAALSTRLHVESCARCAGRIAELDESSARAAGLLSQLSPGAPGNVLIDVRTLHRAAERRGIALSEGGSFMTGVWNRRLVRSATAGAALVAVMALLLLSPMRSVASDVLNSFRVERFAAITIDADQFAEFNTEMLLRFAGSDPEALFESMEGLFTYESTFNLDDMMANVTELDSAEEAEAAFGPFAEPDAVPEGFSATPTYYVSEPGTVDVSFDTAALQTLVDELELPIYSLPDAAQHPTIDLTADIPTALVIEYEGATEDEHLIVAQMTSPTLTTPDYLNMDQLREDILRLPGLPPDFVAQLRAIDDWQSTLIVPVPNGYSSDDVTIDGEPGLLLTADEGDESVVLFEKNGMLYIVAGTASSDTIRDLAEALS